MDVGVSGRGRELARKGGRAKGKEREMKRKINKNRKKDGDERGIERET